MKNTLLLDFIKALPHNAKLLDAGCGTGKTIHMIVDMRPDVHITALDFQDMRSYLPEHTTFTLDSVDNIESIFDEETFDAVICQHVIEHLLYPTAMMEGIHKVLKKGGTLYLECPNWTRLIIPFHQNYFWNDPTHVRPYSKTAFKRLLRDHNLTTLKLKTFSSCGLFTKKDSIGHTASKVTEIKKEEGILILLGTIIKKAFARITSPFLKDVLIVVGKK